MATPIPDATYSIQNGQFPDSVIELHGGNPYGAITAFLRPQSTHLEWIVKNVGKNQITLESVHAPGYYMAVDYQAQSAPALGSANPTYWSVREVSPGKYVIGTKGFVLTLYEGANFSSVLLAKEETDPLPVSQWTFVLVEKSL